VETVIYATPEAPASNNARRDDAQDEVAASRLILEIAGPRSARVGQTCNFEIRVKNPERKSAEKITLSVELPAELVHDVAQALEQHVERLGPGQTYRALVRTRAKAAGKVSLKADVTLPGRTAAKSTATIEIAGGSTTASRSDRAARR
jgi:hypothetical protein